MWLKWFYSFMQMALVIKPSCGFGTKVVRSMGDKTMSNGNVSLTGLNDAESEELHRNLIQGTQFFGMIAALAHLLAYIYSPWLK